MLARQSYKYSVSLTAISFFSSMGRRFSLSPQASLEQLSKKLNVKLLDDNGDTPLHKAIASATRLEDLSTQLNYMGEEAISTMARITNHQGKIPLHYLRQSALMPPEKMIFRSSLMPLLSQHHLRKIQTPLDIDKVLEKYYQPDNVKFNYHLKIACDLANEVRSEIEFSNTHPYVNDLSWAEKKDIDERVDFARRTQDFITTNLSANLLPSNFNAFIYKYIEVTTKVSIKLSAANCHETSFMTLYKALQKDPNTTTYIYDITNGNHLFVVIGEDPNTQVVCDAWAGRVYPARNITKELSNVVKVEKTNDDFINVMTSYNPTFHRLEKIICSSFYNEYLQGKASSKENYAGLFKKYEERDELIELTLRDDHRLSNNKR